MRNYRVIWCRRPSSLWTPYHSLPTAKSTGKPCPLPIGYARRSRADTSYLARRRRERWFRSGASVLRLEQVGIHDNFFELGGNSILSIRIISRANQAGLHFTPKQVFQYQTIAALAAVAGTGALLQGEQGTISGAGSPDAYPALVLRAESCGSAPLQPGVSVAGHRCASPPTSVEPSYRLWYRITMPCGYATCVRGTVAADGNSAS